MQIILTKAKLRKWNNNYSHNKHDIFYLKA